MEYEIAIGDRAYSSWSLRGWLLFENFELPVRTKLVDFSVADVADQLADYFPARTVPAVRFPDGAIIGDSLAIAEELSSRHPDAGHWPSDPTERALARYLAAEMHSSFSALRTDCPMNLRTAYQASGVSDDVKADVARIEAMWEHALKNHGGNGPWLFGQYNVADAFFAPVAARIAGYGLEVGSIAQAYVETHLADGAFRRWRAMGIAKGSTLARYAQTHPQKPWPGPERISAEPIETGVAENDTCPYSGKPVTHLMTAGGKIWGFCNEFCRDKTVADPAAWPKFMAIYD